MRICLVSHGFPPAERTGVENYTEALARALTRAGSEVLVFAPRRDPSNAHLAVRTEERDGYAVHWIAWNDPPDDQLEALQAPGVARQFARLLDRERPQLVHFQHVIKVGLGCVSEAAERGIPIVYTAHDYFPVCHRYTLLRPDLRHCDVRGDTMACSRCDLALGYLNRFPELGDYQAGVFPEDLPAERRAALEGILADEPERAGLGIDAADAAFDRRLEMDALRTRTFARVDLVLAPSAWLAEELVRGGLERERIEVLAYGIENEDLRRLGPPAADPSRPVRFGFFGGLSKHKGLHVLLDAFGRMGGRGELVVYGYSTDEPHVRSLRREAARVGAVWGGPYERAELPRLMAAVDVVVVPSIWVENQPIVIREAFSARRPVLASRLGAIPESVREGVDGLLFEPGDAASLATAMRAVAEHDAVRRLSAGIAPVKDADEQARELLERYERLVDERERAARSSLPSSVRPFAERLAGLDRCSSRELFARVLGGLGQLRRGLGAGQAGQAERADAETVLLRALESGSKTQALLRDGREESTWLRDTIAGLSTARGAQERERAWLEETRSALEQARDALQRERDSLGRERDSLRRELDALRRERDALRREREDLMVGRDALREEREWLQGIVAERDRELEWRKGEAEAGAREIAWLRERLRNFERERTELDASLGRTLSSLGEREEDLRSASQLALAALEAQQRAVGKGLGELIEAQGETPAQDRRLEDLLDALRSATARAEERSRELDWRRAEMEGALRASRRGLVRLFLDRTGLGRRVRAWAPDEEPPAGTGSDGRGAGEGQR